MKKILLILMVVVATISCNIVDVPEANYAEMPVVYAYQLPNHIMAMKYDILPDGQIVKVVDYVNSTISTVKMYQYDANIFEVGDTIKPYLTLKNQK